MEGEYKLVPQFNYTQKEHHEQRRSVWGSKDSKKKKKRKSSGVRNLATPKNRTRVQSKAQLYFTYKYQAHFRLASHYTIKGMFWQCRQCKSSLRSCINIHTAGNTCVDLHCNVIEPLYCL